MSNIGKNIKKIRSVKNLNQTQFAEIFDLKRASIGAYEEGRAEPKIATLSQIAKHFGISVDDLLNKELSVNDLYHFDIFQKDYVKHKSNQLKPSKMPVSLSPVYYIAESKREDYFQGKELSSFIKLNLPIPAISSDYVAFEPNSSMPWVNEQGRAIDLLICRRILNTELKALVGRKLLSYNEGRFFLGQLEKDGESFFIREYRHAERVALLDETICFLTLYELANTISKD